MAVKKTLAQTPPSVYTLNVGGNLFQLSKVNFEKIPTAALEKACLVSTRTSLIGQEWFFDRDPSLFGYILNYYRFGELHVPRNICGTIVQKELEFWGVPESSIGPCCWRSYVNITVEVMQRERVELELQGEDGMVYTEEPTTSIQEYKQKTWRFLYDSDSSRLAKGWALLVYCLIVISVICSFLEECTEYQEWRDILVKCGFDENSYIDRIEMPFITYVEERYLEVTSRNYSLSDKHDFCYTGLSDKDLMRPLREIQFIVSRPNDILIALDAVCISFFTLELISRFVVCPNRLELLKSFMTIIDLLYLISRWGYVITKSLVPVILNYDVSFVIHRAFQIFSCFRVLRIFQLARNVKGLKYFLLTLKASIPILALLLFVVFIFATVLVDMVRKVENLENDRFQDISVGYWWAVVTMSTVGYGDFFPATHLGYAIGGLCVLLGPIIIAFFVPIISGNFLLYYGYRERPIVKCRKSSHSSCQKESINPMEEETLNNSKMVYV